MRAIWVFSALAFSAACAPVEQEATLDLADYLAREQGLTEYRQADHDLNGDGSPEHIVLAASRELCGTGGCTMFVLRKSNGETELVSKTTVVNTPVRLLESRTNGWLNLEVRARSDATTSWQSKLVFDGSGYTSNPTVPPAEKVSGLPGEVIFD